MKYAPISSVRFLCIKIFCRTIESVSLPTENLGKYTVGIVNSFFKFKLIFISRFITSSCFLKVNMLLFVVFKTIVCFFGYSLRFKNRALVITIKLSIISYRLLYQQNYLLYFYCYSISAIHT